MGGAAAGATSAGGLSALSEAEDLGAVEEPGLSKGDSITSFVSGLRI